MNFFPIRSSLLVVIFGALSCATFAQIPAGPNLSLVPTVKEEAHAPEKEESGYLLGAGDTLQIDISDMPEISTKSVKVGADGVLDLPMIGSISVAGISVSQLRSVLVSRVSRYVTDPIVTINVVSNGSRFVSVIGEVNSPGLHPLDGPRSLVEVISEAGGVKADAGPQVIVTRSNTRGPLPAVAGAKPTSGEGITRLTLSLNDLLASSTPGTNLSIQPGDTVSIPKEQLIYVVGAVRRAGGFPMSSRESVSVLQAMSLAEGSSPNASLKSAKILRPELGSTSVPKELPIDLNAILAGKAPDQALFANDILFIPNSAAKSGAKRAAEVMLQVATGVAIYR